MLNSVDLELGRFGLLLAELNLLWTARLSEVKTFSNNELFYKGKHLVKTTCSSLYVEHIS